MSTREKVLVGLMVVALLYAALELLYFLSDESPSGRQGPGFDTESARDLSAKEAQRLAESDLETIHAHVLRAAMREAAKEPFQPRPDYLLETDEAEDFTAEESKGRKMDSPRFVYSGYLEMGRIRMAVINGIEYRAGDELEDADYMVIDIKPEKVLLQSSTGRNRTSVPYAKGSR